jgi:hypothetical protein
MSVAFCCRKGIKNHIFDGPSKEVKIDGKNDEKQNGARMHFSHSYVEASYELFTGTLPVGHAMPHAERGKGVITISNVYYRHDLLDLKAGQLRFVS